MDFLKKWKYLNLLIAASSEKVVSVRNSQGDYFRKPARISAVNELKRPPFILSAPNEKKQWSQEEIAEFYKTNPMLNI